MKSPLNVLSTKAHQQMKNRPTVIVMISDMITLRAFALSKSANDMTMFITTLSIGLDRFKLCLYCYDANHNTQLLLLKYECIEWHNKWIHTSAFSAKSSISAYKSTPSAIFFIYHQLYFRTMCSTTNISEKKVSSWLLSHILSQGFFFADSRIHQIRVVVFTEGPSSVHLPWIGLVKCRLLLLNRGRSKYGWSPGRMTFGIPQFWRRHLVHIAMHAHRRYENDR